MRLLPERGGPVEDDVQRLVSKVGYVGHGLTHEEPLPVARIEASCHPPAAARTHPFPPLLWKSNILPSRSSRPGSWTPVRQDRRLRPGPDDGLAYLDSKTPLENATRFESGDQTEGSSCPLLVVRREKTLPTCSTEFYGGR